MLLQVYYSFNEHSSLIFDVLFHGPDCPGFSVGIYCVAYYVDTGENHNGPTSKGQLEEIAASQDIFKQTEEHSPLFYNSFIHSSESWRTDPWVLWAERDPVYLGIKVNSQPFRSQGF